ncbi:Os01g0129950 [Oryza sativa Japonica Group]|uniref:Os01g0129950 protein n=1 Tax=Oryza sativa subsp. japonica TaxID=39947 RepID=C7IXJ0_ORYSJ|nr:Os01g0129950 [Oryza sativa Japonica Group]|eukprot:NP_001172160.1 Os01g0129950 [Oryza sativa Japonica Group]
MLQGDDDCAAARYTVPRLGLTLVYGSPPRPGSICPDPATTTTTTTTDSSHAPRPASISIHPSYRLPCCYLSPLHVMNLPGRTPIAMNASHHKSMLLLMHKGKR